MEVLKRALAVLFLCAMPSLADQIAQDTFGYLNNNEALVIIDPTEAQDLLNIDVTPSGKSIKKRAGYGLYKTLGSNAAVHGGHHFYDSSGNDVQLWGSGTNLYGSTNDAAFVTLVSSATSGTTWDCADTSGYAYCVNTSRNVLLKTDGATINWYSSPLGTMAAVTPERLVISGVSGALNTLYFSEANNYINFTAANATTSPWTEVIASPGSRITHIEYACGKLLWWKDQSFGYVQGTDQTNISVGIISSQIGTQDNSSTTDPDGNVYFRGQDGHLYRYNCANVEKMSVDISPNIQSSGRRTSNSWTVSSASDFSAGSLSNATATASGIIISTNNTNIPGNSFETGHGWTCTSCTGDFTNGGTFGANCGSLPPPDGTKQFLYQTASTSFTVTAELIDAVSSTTYATGSYSYAASSCSANTGITRTIPVAGAGFRKRVKLKLSLDSNRAVIYSQEFTGNGNNITFVMATDPNVGSTLRQATIDFFQGGYTDSTSPGIFYSAVKNMPNLTSWDTFSAVKTDDNATHNFYYRSSTNTFTVLSSTPAWTAATLGSVITVSTGTYFQFKDSMTVTASSQNPVFQSATTNWFEGTASDKTYAQYFDNAIWWSVAYGSGQATNNYIFKFDLLRNGWTLYNFGTGGFLVQNNNLYFGTTGATGKIYRYGGSATSDDGTAINAYWQSKDYPGTDPWIENEYLQLDTFARRNAGQTLTVGYTLNGSTTTTSYSVSLSSTTDNVIRNKKLLPTGKIGGVINVKFSDSSATSAWEVLGFRLNYRTLTYRPTQ